MSTVGMLDGFGDEPTISEDELKLLKIRDLPPLPRPDYKTKFSESACGTTVVCVLIGGVLGLANAFIKGDIGDSTSITASFAVMYSWAIIAFGCLFYILLGDPGVIKRTPSNCCNFPPEVTNLLNRGESPSTMDSNVTVGDRSFCIRCLLWREEKQKPHHCSTCQRCVYGFDHHCGVFGRCIAGGNIIPFRLILFCALGGIISVVVITMAQSS